MPLKYAMTSNRFQKEGPQRPRLVEQKRLGFQDFLQSMTTTCLSPRTLTMVLTIFAETLLSELEKGYAVETPLGLFSLGVGVAKDGKVRCVRLHVRTATKAFRRYLNSVKVKKVDCPEPLGPVLDSLSAVDGSGFVCGGRVGKLFQLRGSRLSFSAEDDRLGVFFVDSKQKVRAGVYSRTGCRLVGFQLPPLEPGVYSVEIRTLSRGNEILTAALKEVFTVEE